MSFRCYKRRYITSVNILKTVVSLNFVNSLNFNSIERGKEANLLRSEYFIDSYEL